MKGKWKIALSTLEKLPWRQFLNVLMRKKNWIAHKIYFNMEEYNKQKSLEVKDFKKRVKEKYQIQKEHLLDEGD